MRAVALVVCVACSSLGSGCTKQQAPIARTVGKVVSLAGVGGLIASALGARFVGHGQELLAGFSIVSGAGIVTYAVGEMSQPSVIYKEEPIPQRNHRWAKILTERAAGAARDGRCARVRRLEVRVQRYDAAIHDLVFMRDPEIVKCLDAASSPSGLFPTQTQEPVHLPPQDLTPGDGAPPTPPGDGSPSPDAGSSAPPPSTPAP